MSYILEALKKSERERQRGNITALQTPSQVVLNQRSMWVGILIGVVALSAIVAVGWVVNRQLIHFGPGAPAESGAPLPRPESQGLNHESRQEVGRNVEQGAVRETTARRDQGLKPAATDAAAPTVDIAEPASSGTVRDVDNMAELDPADRARIQRLSLNVVSYSEVPSRRFVMINQRIAHESESVGDGVIVDRILPGGALLRVGGYRIMIRPD